MNVREYTLWLLKETECELDYYRNDKYGALSDMRLYAQDHDIPFSVEEIAEELVRIGNEQQRQPEKQFLLVLDTEHSSDGEECETLEEALSRAEDTYAEWASEEYSKWNFGDDGTPSPTEQQIEDFNYMVENCCCYVVRRREDGSWGEIDDDDTVFLNDDKKRLIGWTPFENI